MYVSQVAEELPSLPEDTEGIPGASDLSVLHRENHFCQFLRKELGFCRTKAEREVVEVALLRTNAEVRRLEKLLEPLLPSCELTNVPLLESSIEA
jgi:hypothetical protein